MPPQNPLQSELFELLINFTQSTVEIIATVMVC
jgi:hypothetical protein